MRRVQREHRGLALRFSAVTCGLAGEMLANEGDTGPDTKLQTADKTGR